MDRPSRDRAPPRGAPVGRGGSHPEAARAPGARGVDRGVRREPRLALDVAAAAATHGRGGLEIARHADIGPELVDREAADVQPGVDRRTDELVHVEARTRWNEAGELRLQHVDPAVHEMAELGLFADAGDPRAVRLD